MLLYMSFKTSNQNMGIKNLNHFLLDNCSKTSIRKIHLSELKGKTLVIDTSIYLYKFSLKSELLENMYLFVSLMHQHDITPIFVFDGKPPDEKNELLQQRKITKDEAEKKYNLLAMSVNSTSISKHQRSEIQTKMDSLKTQFVRITNTQIKQVKDLLVAYGIEYYESIHESDELCALLVKTGKAWGCFSDDMDMFIYDCPYVIRGVSLMNQTVFLYDKAAILTDLELSNKLFQEIMILSGTDYNIHSKTSLYDTVMWLYEYRKYLKNYSNKDKETTKKPLEFFVWLVKHTKYIEDYSRLLHIYKMFILDISEDTSIPIYKNHIVPYGINMNSLKHIMRDEGFIFL